MLCISHLFIQGSPAKLSVQLLFCMYWARVVLPEMWLFLYGEGWDRDAEISFVEGIVWDLKRWG